MTEGLRNSLSFLAFTFLPVLFAISAANAQVIFTPNQITKTPLQPNLTGTNLAILYQPPSNSKSHVGIFIMHPDAGYSTFSGCTGLAQRGYTLLCADTVYNNRIQDFKGYEDQTPGIIAGVNYLRNKVPGITKVLIFGHSMGGPMMAFYDNIQENGVAACKAPQRIIACDTTNLVDSKGNNILPPVDGVILFDAHLGDALATFTYVDPAVVNPDKPAIRKRSVDMFAPQNGYPGDANAGPPNFQSANYKPEFAERFLDAQADRNADLLSQAQELWEQIQEGAPGVYHDDMPFIVPASNSAARLWQADLNLVNCTQKPHIFITHTGIQNPSPGSICSVRIPSASAAGDESYASHLSVSVRIWLGAHALRTNGIYTQTINDLTGIDYDSSNTSTVANIKGVSKPLLIVANGGHYFLRPDEIVYDNAKSTDKTFAIEEGSVHGGTECTACEQARGLPKGYYGDTLDRTFDFMDSWIAARF